MFCMKCGKEVQENFVACPFCGAPTKEAAPAATPPAYQPAPPAYQAPSPPNFGSKACPRCGSFNTSAQVVNQIKLKNDHKGCLWWGFVGVWWVPMKWMIFTLPAIIFKIFSHKKQKAVNTTVSMLVCNNCGNNWKA
jgi:hypothetical protein